jgi:hypothetical protein
MPSRFAIAAIFAIFLATSLNYAQIISDVVVLNATINDGYGGWSECVGPNVVWTGKSIAIRAAM